MTTESNTAAVRVDVPFVDLAAIHRDLKESILADLGAIIDTSSFVNGPAVAAFESAFAEYCGAAHAVGVASGLDALRLALIAAGLEAHDEVVVPANTFVATLEAISQAGGVPLLVDVSESDYNIDPAAVAAAVGRRTRFIVPVHLYGQMADVIALEGLSAGGGFILVEDACQAHGAERDGCRAGTLGTAAAFSFYPGKNLGAMGDAGAVVTEDQSLASAVCALREHGQTNKYHHDLEGWTARLDTMQAAILLRKLVHLDHWNEQRRAAAAYYNHALEHVGDLRLMPVPDGSDPVWHLYVVRTHDPEGLAGALARRGIATGRHYPVPPHLSGAYSHLRRKRGAFPVAEQLARELLSLPIYPGISEAQLEAVVDGVVDYFDHGT